jgi:hypothetical protein
MKAKPSSGLGMDTPFVFLPIMTHKQINGGTQFTFPFEISDDLPTQIKFGGVKRRF